MTEFLGIPPHLLLLLPLSVAAGIDLFLTLLLIVASSALDWGAPPGEAPHLRFLVLTILALLYLLETSMELRPLRALVWHNLQLVLRPLVAFLLAFAILEGAQPLTLLLVGAGSALVAALSHVLSWGRKLRGFLGERPRISPLTQALAEDTLVLLLLVLAFESPGPAFLVAAGALLISTVRGRTFLELTLFGTALLRDRIGGIISPIRWIERAELPAWIGEWSLAQGFVSVRGLRAGAFELTRTRGFRAGWLLEAGSQRYFAFRCLKGGVFLSFGSLHMFPEGTSAIALKASGEDSQGARWALFLQRGAPGPESHK